MRKLKGIYPAIVTAFDGEGAYDPDLEVSVSTRLGLFQLLDGLCGLDFPGVVALSVPDSHRRGQDETAPRVDSASSMVSGSTSSSTSDLLWHPCRKSFARKGLTLALLLREFMNFSHGIPCLSVGFGERHHSPTPAHAAK